jgi:hypothetical protein
LAVNVYRERRQGARAELRPAAQLAELGVTKSQRNRLQKFSALDDEAFEARATGAKKRPVNSP